VAWKTARLFFIAGIPNQVLKHFYYLINGVNARIFSFGLANLTLK